MTHALLPALWLIVLIVGLPQLSETVYTPSLPDIAHALHAEESMVEYTLTVDGRIYSHYLPLWLCHWHLILG